jgi:hypothetical protein
VEESHAPIPEPASGTHPTAADRGELPVREPGESVDPEEIGTQFLRDATEQDNFESTLRRRDIDAGDVPLGSLISEGTLRAAGQMDVAIPQSEALSGARSFDDDAKLEPNTDELDLLDNSIREGSLFDQPTADGDVVTPNVNADEMAVRDEHRSKRGRAEPAGGPIDVDDDSEVDADGQRDWDEATRVRPTPPRRAPR